MIAKLTGILDSLGDGHAVIDVGGVGYLVSCSARTLRRMGPGEPVVLLVDTHVREDAIQLYGFADEGERSWFRLLISVQGVGAKAALAILGALAPDDLALAIASGDRTAVTRAPGVGPKLATRILSVLKDKVGSAGVPTASGAAAAPVLPGDAGDAVAALVNLGFAPSEAMSAVAAATGTLGGGIGVEALIRDGLARLAPRHDAP